MTKLTILAATLLLTTVAAQARDDKQGQGQGMAQAQGHVAGKSQAEAHKGDKGPKQAQSGKASRGQKAEQRGPVLRDFGDNARRDEWPSERRVANLRGVPGRGKGLINGCPPGLAKKHNGCRPPGQAAKNAWQRAEWFGYRTSDRYRFQDGYLLRLGSGGNIIGYDPLLGGVLRIGNRWPDGQTSFSLRDYDRNFYNLGSDSGYRSYGNTVYRVDPETAAIQSIAALLTGQDITVGQPMTSGYEVYNVPNAYRSQYTDGPTAQYRYSDGRVYQVDPKTRLVQAAIELLI